MEMQTAGSHSDLSQGVWTMVRKWNWTLLNVSEDMINAYKGNISGTKGLTNLVEKAWRDLMARSQSQASSETWRVTISKKEK